MKNTIESNEWAANHLNEYFSEHGFRSGRSCLAIFLDLMEEATRELDNVNCIDVV